MSLRYQVRRYLYNKSNRKSTREYVKLASPQMYLSNQVLPVPRELPVPQGIRDTREKKEPLENLVHGDCLIPKNIQVQMDMKDLTDHRFSMAERVTQATSILLKKKKMLDRPTNQSIKETTVT